MSLCLHQCFIYICLFSIMKLSRCQICDVDNDCGWNAECRVDKRCWCQSGYVWSYNEKDCIDLSCESECISCENNATCTRCVDFMDVDTGQCISQCSGTYHLALSGDRRGKQCKVVKPTMEALSDVHLAVLFTSCGVVIMIVMLGLCLYCHVRGKKGHFHVPEHEIIDAYNISSSTVSYMQERMPDSSLMNGHANHYGVYTIHPDPHNMVAASVFTYQEKEEFMQRLNELRPHMNTILAMVNEARKKTHSLLPDDPLAKNSKSVVQQLCRVLTLLNRKEPEIMMPTDGIKLLKWTDTILHKYLQTHKGSPTSPTSSTPKPKTSELPKLSCYDDNDKKQIVPPANNNTIPYMGMSRSNSNASQQGQSNSVMHSPSTYSTQELIIKSTAEDNNGTASYNTRVVKRQHSTNSVESPFSTFGYERVTDIECSTTTCNHTIPNARKFSTLPRNFAFALEETTDAITV